ncbi:short-chain dehydrogenase/reductase SDR [Acidisarcina polymorpha]|uniref:Short-chain dehydrogenase/reductase SDR n=1 Tax=Acidisarcina polymorpha TaxID=2211140 RepID=A0A2Z5FU61_9BACT|nr:short-chain dehydrogenase/reductase SDR [Acidisarcina polymorpha]
MMGGATGIGFAIAELAHNQGASVVVGSSNEEKVRTASSRLRDATGYAVDLRDESSVRDFFKQVAEFDHLAITAGDWGGPMFVSVHDLDLKQAQELLSVRFWGALSAVKHCCQTIARNGSITLTSGMIGHRPRKGAPIMAAVGGAVEHLTAGLAMDLNPVRVNAVNPGYVLTEQLKRLPEAALQSAVASLPIPRAATPQEAAQAYLYLMLNNYATGQTLSVDGGGLLV